MALEPRRKSMLRGRHPAEPEATASSTEQQHESNNAVSSDDDGLSRGRAGSGRAGSERAGSGRAGSERAGSGRAGSERAGAPDPEGETRKAEPEIQVPEPERASGTAGNASSGRQVSWTDEAKKVRSELTAWAAARRKAAGRASQARDAAGNVPADELAVIVEKVAEATGEAVREVRHAAGLPPNG